jgi:hypothetical protein
MLTVNRDILWPEVFVFMVGVTDDGDFPFDVIIGTPACHTINTTTIGGELEVSDTSSHTRVWLL